MNLQIGQKVYVKKIGNAARYLDQKNAPIEEYVEEATVSKIGRKWFELEGHGRIAGHRFDIESGQNDGRGYISDYAVYQSWQEIRDEQERYQLRVYMRKTFDYPSQIHLSLTKLRAIKEIIEVDD
jgi:hypothetical protein